jgi:DUF4097 and DUF4098 domain-containing protein YvlB
MLIAFMCSSLAKAQDFQRSFTLPAGSDISIRNVAGNIKVVGYDGETILVTAYKEGRDRDQVEIVDMSSEDNISIHVQYPGYGNVSASVNFQVQTPRGVPYNYEDISSVSGDIWISSITGQVRVSGVSGRVQIHDFFGVANACSVSGDVSVQLTQPVAKGNMMFASISGNVVVHAPADLEAYVEMSTIIGMLWTDFPVRITWRWPFVGRSAKGRLGNGTARLTISSISGQVCLLANR